MPNFFNKKIKDEKLLDAYERGIEYQRAGDYQSAVKELTSVIEADPFFIEAYNSLGLTFKRMGDFDNAIKYYNQGIEAHFQIIYNHIKENPVRELNDRYASTKSSTWMEVATQIAVKNSAKDRIKNARFPTGESAVKMSDENSFAGLAFYDENDTRYVLPAYFSSIYEALKSDLFYSIIVNNVGTAFAETGDKEQARKCYMESIEFIPQGVKYDDPFLGLREIEE